MFIPDTDHVYSIVKPKAFDLELCKLVTELLQPYDYDDPISRVGYAFFPEEVVAEIAKTFEGDMSGRLRQISSIRPGLSRQNLADNFLLFYRDDEAVGYVVDAGAMGFGIVIKKSFEKQGMAGFFATRAFERLGRNPQTERGAAASCARQYADELQQAAR